MSKVIGIALGTTNSVVPVMEGVADAERIRPAQEGLTIASRTLAEAAYPESRSGATGGAQTSSGPSDGDVVDAEFTDTTDRKP